MTFFSNRFNLMAKSTKVLLTILIIQVAITSWTAASFELLTYVKPKVTASADVAQTTKTEGIKKTEEPKSEPSKETPPAKEPSTEERPAEETPTEPAPEQQTEPAPEPTPPASEPEPEPAVTGEIQVLGDESCQSRVGAALNFLESQASVHYTLANQYLSFIECGEVGSSINPATSQVRFTLGEATLTQGKMWIAGIIAHEYCHVKLYRDGQTYNGPVGETKCLEVQYDALEKMGADPVLLDYVKNLAETEWWSDPNRWW